MAKGSYVVEWTCDAPYPSFSRRTSISILFSDFGSEWEAKQIAEALRVLPAAVVKRRVESEEVV